MVGICLKAWKKVLWLVALGGGPGVCGGREDAQGRLQLYAAGLPYAKSKAKASPWCGLARGGGTLCENPEEDARVGPLGGGSWGWWEVGVHGGGSSSTLRGPSRPNLRLERDFGVG